MEINGILIIVLLVVVLLAGMFLIPQWRLRRAIHQVIRIFRDHNAVSVRDAKTVDALGLRPRGMLEGMFSVRLRDYKKHALDALMKADIIQTTDDGRLYLSEDKLFASGLDKSSPYSR